MDYLIDAHALLWHRNRDTRLSEKARSVLEGNSSGLIVSDVTFWEVSIKLSIGKLALDGGLESLRSEWIQKEAAESLSIKWNHIAVLAKLPLIHRDPFDRMLIAQALEENLTILTCDVNIPQYPRVKSVW